MTAYVPSRSPATECRWCGEPVFRLKREWLHVATWRSGCPDPLATRAEPIRQA